MKLFACGASVVGPGHLDQREPNQDALVLTGFRGGWIVAVADGLGSRSLSGLGARRACQVSRRVLRTAPSCLDFSTILPSIHRQWIGAIEPNSPTEAATTLLFARVTAGGNVQSAQLGDGLLLLRCNGIFRRVTPERAGFGNQTWALGPTYLQDKWTTAEGCFSQPGDGVALMTDGVADDLDPNQLAEFFEAFYRNTSIRNRRRGNRWLQSELSDWATPLHGDDKTLAAIFRMPK